MNQGYAFAHGTLDRAGERRTDEAWLEAVHIPFFQKLLVDGEFRGDALQEKAASVMLDELLRWTSALKVLRPT